MQITSLGHAGLRVDGPDLRLVFDPWLGGRGAFFGSWFPFPSNLHLDASALVDSDWAAVSHDHLDHLDAATLALLPPSATVLVPAYPSGNMRRRLAAAGIGPDRVREVAPWEQFRLNDAGDWLTFIPEASPVCHDAAVLLVAGDRSLLHCNDARITASQGRRASLAAGGRLDVMAVQTAGASWHPICYEYPDDVRRHIEADKREGKLRAVGRLLKAVEPVLAVPFAGPPCFLDPALAGFNDSIPAPGIFPDQAQATAWLSRYLPKQQVRHLMPGDRYDAEAGALEADEHWAGFDYDDRELVAAHIAGYAEERAPAVAAAYAACPPPTTDLWPRFEDHIARLGELSPWFLERIDMPVRFDVVGEGGGLWDAHFQPGRVRAERVATNGHHAANAVPYRISVDSRWLAPVLDGRSTWEDVLLSLRISCKRNPDLYNDYLVGLLKHADADALDAVEIWETEAAAARAGVGTITVEAGGQRYEVSRLCPHAGEDLSVGAVIVGDRLRCLGHNYEFDLTTGECVNARCAPLSSKPVD